MGIGIPEERSEAAREVPLVGEVALAVDAQGPPVQLGVDVLSEEVVLEVVEGDVATLDAPTAPAVAGVELECSGGVVEGILVDAGAAAARFEEEPAVLGHGRRSGQGSKDGQGQQQISCF